MRPDHPDPPAGETMTVDGATSSTVDIPWIVSVDDHVIEPASLRVSRLPERYGDPLPRRTASGRRGNAIRVFGLDSSPEPKIS
jgi:hypothetical protein